MAGRLALPHARWLLGALAAVLALTLVGPATPSRAAGEPALPFRGFATSGFTLRPLPPEQWPFYGPGTRSRITTSVTVGGRRYLHPVRLAQDGYRLLNAYRQWRRPADLAAAQAIGRTLVSQVTPVATPNGTAWFVRHTYPFALHSDPAERMPQPFYSGMAQGEVLGLFTRLAATTGSSYWRVAADRVFTSFLVPRSTAPGRPWVVEVKAGRLWLQEWPRLPLADDTLNGHLFAAFGLADYARLRGSARALRLMDAALTTALASLPTLRTSGWISRYCLRHPAIRSAGYHAVHIGQLTTWYRLTGNPVFARWADTLAADYPVGAESGVLRLAAGTHVGVAYRGGAVAGRRAITLATPASVRFDARARPARGAPVSLRVASGSLRGLWVAESPRGYAVGVHAVRTWAPDRVVVLTRTVAAVRLGRDGAVSARLALSAGATRASGAAIVNGRRHLRLAGTASGWWLPVSSSVSLR